MDGRPCCIIVAGWSDIETVVANQAVFIASKSRVVIHIIEDSFAEIEKKRIGLGGMSNVFDDFSFKGLFAGRDVLCFDWKAIDGIGSSGIYSDGYLA